MRLNWEDYLDDIWLFHLNVDALSAPKTWIHEIATGSRSSWWYAIPMPDCVC